MRKPSFRKTLILGAVTGCLLVAAVTTDRVAASAAADRLADRLRCAGGLPSEPSVAFGGFPFLTQVARGRFDGLRVTAAGVPAGRFRVGVEATATGVRLPEGEAVRADSLTATITVGYDLLRESSREPGGAEPSGPAPIPGGPPAGFTGDVTADDAGRLLLSTTRTMLGREVPVTVVAAPEIAGTTLTVRPIEVELPAMGLRLPATRLPGLRAPRVDLPALPTGLTWTGAAAGPDGLRLTVEGAGLVADTRPARAAAGGCGGAA
ncbi:hypothetical protein Aph02nite_13630 [Actinoplanes philippinensis]|uniref:DUF2993 domain-containing protein n=1 Tax=Actinoplanes philippinensis TaxID=35752 RepID=A0A1I1ZLQ1_9ACTN|nr:DUF2993 domain-containing protein [Actinoplanes philippinensis]GIE75413.1 hypothetical protein Aph02nite_13630 [Actinoplanes philippinensis]SFE32626.1 Protein of unknown function [Actinoplanes philippinensis]